MFELWGQALVLLIHQRNGPPASCLCEPQIPLYDSLNPTYSHKPSTAEQTVGVAWVAWICSFVGCSLVVCVFMRVCYHNSKVWKGRCERTRHRTNRKRRMKGNDAQTACCKPEVYVVVAGCVSVVRACARRKRGGPRKLKRVSPPFVQWCQLTSSWAVCCPSTFHTIAYLPDYIPTLYTLTRFMRFYQAGLRESASDHTGPSCCKKPEVPNPKEEIRFVCVLAAVESPVCVCVKL